MAQYELSSLPTEIITMILGNNNYKDILNFGATCKAFHKIVSSDVIWKMSAKKELRADVYKFIDKTKLSWYEEVKSYYSIKKNVYAELLTMSPKYFKKIHEITLWDIRDFFPIALANKTSYYYTIANLQDFIKTAHEHIERNDAKIPYTMTEVYYAKIIVAHLVQTYLAVKWVKLEISNELHPHVVINYFLQWTDPANMYDDDDVEEMINDMAIKVQQFVDDPKTSFESPPGFEKEQGVCAGIAHVLSNDNPLNITREVHLDTINMAKILDTKLWSFVAVCAIYYAVATRCGVKCQLVAFPNHLYLEIQDTDQQKRDVHTVDVASGKLHKRRQCVYAARSERKGTIAKYCPGSLLNNVCTAFHVATGHMNWHTHNVFNLFYFLTFMHTNTSNDNTSYIQLQPFLLEQSSTLKSLKLNIKYLDDALFGLLHSLLNLNPADEEIHYEVTVKRRESNVRYAVGMICHHKNFEYECVVRGWTFATQERRAPHSPSADRPQRGQEQPYYKVIALDFSERYVPQEYLVHVARPSRLPQLEDTIGRDFTHFDGFSYVPNEQKQEEYPEDKCVVDLFRSRAAMSSHSD